MNRTRAHLRNWLRAFSLSLGAVAALTLLVGLGVLATADRHLTPGTYLSVHHCELPSPGQPAIVTLWTAHCGVGGRHRPQLALVALDSTRPAIWSPWNLVPSAMTATGDGRRGFVSDTEGNLFEISPEQPSAEPRHLGRHAGSPPHTLAVSSDGRWLASLDLLCLCVWDLQSHAIAWQLADESVRCLCLTPDGRGVICGLADGWVVEHELATGLLARRITSHPSRVWNVEVCPGGNQVASLCFSHCLRVTDRHTGALRWQRACRVAMPAMRFSPNGDQLATVECPGIVEICLWEATSGQGRGRLRGHDNAVHGFAYQQEGQLTSWGADGTIRMWDLGTGLAHVVRPGASRWFASPW